MQDIIQRYYHFLFFCLIFLLIGLSFYAGTLQGKGSTSDQVTLSCDPHTLTALSIPLKALSSTNTSPTSLPSNVAASVSGTLDNTSAQLSTKAGKYVGSKNGTKYYERNCATVKRIKPANYVWFQSVLDAQLQGYTAGKC